HPPIGVAGVTPNSATLLLAGERGYIPMSINFVPARILGTHWDAVESGARRAGRTAERAAWRIARDVYVADTTERARREVLEGTLARDWSEYFLPLLRKIKMLDLVKVDPTMPDAAVSLEYLLDHIWVVGDPESVAEKLGRLERDVGGFGTLLVIAHEWQPRAAWERSMTLLAREVLPRLG
ncbi:MAG: LLM class flavin-dependent oxidoreductase, partial [Candidatus Rokubacteria bacterium]|nr:LLM class flavin-dependent oxidoreductase [Candidatus Rokubacteria bacterium]